MMVVTAKLLARSESQRAEGQERKTRRRWYPEAKGSGAGRRGRTARDRPKRTEKRHSGGLLLPCPAPAPPSQMSPTEK